jgi:GT2 family glycosyltransferase
VLKQANGEFILFLNPDTILPEDCLQKCIGFFQEKHEAGAIGIRMIDGSGIFLKESKRGFPSPVTSICKLSGLTSLFPNSKFFAHYYLGHLDQNQNQEVDVLSGAFMMIRKSVLGKTGGWDEQFFMYGEDIDLSFRIQKAGWKNFYFAESTIIHFKGESTKKDSGDYTKLFYGAMGIFVKKHYNIVLARLYILLIRLMIKIKIAFSRIKYQLHSFLHNKNKTAPKERCFIISDKKEFNFIQSILQKNKIELDVIGRVDPGISTSDDVVGNVSILPSLISREHVKELIFAMNSMSAKETISIIERLPAGLHFRFHFAGTHSIVGSNNKESSGNCVA